MHGAPTTFARWLRAEIDQRDLEAQKERRRFGVRTLAAKIVSKREVEIPGDIETVRRALNKYLLDGVLPAPLARLEIARALDVPLVEIPEEQSVVEDDISALLRKLAERFEKQPA